MRSSAWRHYHYGHREVTEWTQICANINRSSRQLSDIMIWTDAWIDIEIKSELTVTENTKCERIGSRYTMNFAAHTKSRYHVGFNINYLSNSSVRNKLPALPQFFSSNFVSCLWSWTRCQLWLGKPQGKQGKDHIQWSWSQAPETDTLLVRSKSCKSQSLCK